MNMLPAAAAALWVAVAPAAAQPPPDYGFEWRTIGVPGNAPASVQQFPRLQPPFGPGPIGQVNYEYRMARTEITVSQWAEFVQAYANHNPSEASNIQLTGRYITLTGGSPGNWEYFVPPGLVNAPTTLSWIYAARYCNWLTNSKVNEA